MKRADGVKTKINVVDIHLLSKLNVVDFYFHKSFFYAETITELTLVDYLLVRQIGLVVKFER